jgi:Fe-S-cluster containining protein
MLSHWLKLLEEHGLVERRCYSHHPPRAEKYYADSAAVMVNGYAGGSFMPAAVITDLVQIQRAAVAQADENSAFRTFVTLELELSDRRLNTIVTETTVEVWQHIDCRTCANCCRSQHPTFSRPEVQRIAAYLDLSVEELQARYLTSDASSGKYITRELPCPFLEDNLCAIYEVRPAVCAGYPHLQRNLRSRLWQTIDNAAVCPIVYNVLEGLKQRLGFRERA